MKKCTVVLERLDFARFTVNLRPQTRRDIRENNRSRAEKKRSHEEKYRNMRMDELNLVRKCIPISEKLTRPQILKNAANYIQQLLNPDFMAQDQEKLPRRPDIKETKERERVFSQDYRNAMKKGYNLLRKWVPDTARSSTQELLKKTVKYIQELEQRSPVEKRGIQELEQKIKELEKESEKKENYIKGLEAKIKELETSEEEKLLRSPEEEEEFLVSPEEEMELLASLEELPDFNNMEDFIQWLEL
jgi:uncharacterized coiled-coil protein SlyX